MKVEPFSAASFNIRVIERLSIFLGLSSDLSSERRRGFRGGFGRSINSVVVSEGIPMGVVIGIRGV